MSTTALILPEATTHFRLLKKDLPIPATTGRETFVTERSMFPGYFDPAFESLSKGPSQPLPARTGNLYEQIEDGDYEDLLGSFKIDLKQHLLTEHQALAFIRAHPEYFGNPDPSVRFLLEGEFVAVVRRGGGRLMAVANPFDYDVVWRAEFRSRLLLCN